MIVETSAGPHVPERRWQFAVTSGILGWLLDAFDFFVLVFLFDVLAQHFHVSKDAIKVTIPVTLVMRPVGAFLLGSLADRYGRKRPLIACVIYFSIVTALTPFAPNYITFLLLRGLYGIGMGGYWGIGASMVMESSPMRWRGLFSGIMQSGYSMGYLLAAVAMRTIEPRFGWKWLFLVGLILAGVIAVLTLLSPESRAWEKNRLSSYGEIFSILGRHGKTLLYCVVLMTVMICLSHGTQDLYPDFLKTDHHFSNTLVSNLAILFNIGAIVGALSIGPLSDRIGRRYCIMIALLLSLCSIPAWAFGSSVAMLAVGSFLMQFGVQGAWGVIPAHLNELSPSPIRSLFPGFVYQLGTLMGGVGFSGEVALQKRFGYPWALTAFESAVIVSLLLLYAFGPERRGRDLNLAD